MVGRWRCNPLRRRSATCLTARDSLDTADGLPRPATGTLILRPTISTLRNSLSLPLLLLQLSVVNVRTFSHSLHTSADCSIKLLMFSSMAQPFKWLSCFSYLCTKNMEFLTSSHSAVSNILSILDVIQRPTTFSQPILSPNIHPQCTLILFRDFGAI